MSDKRSEAQQARRSREREAAAEAAAAAAESASETIPDGASVESGASPVQPKTDHSARMEMLESLRNKPEDMNEYIRNETEDTPSASEPSAQVKEDASAAADAASTSAPAPEAASEPPAAPELVTVKIDGVESQVPKSEIDAVGSVAAYQILKATERRLEKANQQNHEMARLLEQARTLHVKPQEPAPDPQKQLLERVQKLQFGTPEEATQAMQELLSAQRVDPNQIVAQVSDRVAQNMAAQQFAARNGDLLQNPLFAKLALIAEHDKLSKSRPSDWGKFYSDLETEIRGSLRLPATTPAATTPQSSQPTSGSDKLSRKDNIVILPEASARVPAKEEEKPLSRDDRLNLLRKARGQPMG